MNISATPARRRIIARAYAVLSSLPVKLRTDAGWRRLRITGIISIASALAADFVKPVIWIVPPVTIVALVVLVVTASAYWWFRRSNAYALVWLPARMTIVSAMVAVVFGAVWSAQATVPSEETVTGHVLRMALEVQDSLKSLEERFDQVGQEVGRVRVLMEEGAAREALRRAQETRDYADYGQVAAIESIVASGGNMARAALSGIDLDGINLSGASLPEARLSFARIAGAQLTEADLSGVSLSLSTLDEADFRGANLAGAQLTLARADAADFRGIQAEGANFSAARLHGAKFGGTKLQQVRFAFADLTGADFTGADLTDALFIGANLDGAVFDGATFSNTDITGVTNFPEALMAADASDLCRTESSRGMHALQVTVIERIPTSRFEGGIEYYPMFDERFAYQADHAAELPICQRRAFAEDWNFPIWTYGGRENLAESFSLSFSQEFLEGGDRQRELLRRIREHFQAVSR